jgi:hypothetical protein
MGEVKYIAVFKSEAFKQILEWAHSEIKVSSHCAKSKNF